MTIGAFVGIEAGVGAGANAAGAGAGAGATLNGFDCVNGPCDGAGAGENPFEFACPLLSV